MNQSSGDIIERSYKTVEDMLTDAVSGARSKEDFIHNLGYCQMVGQRMLAILIYNSSVQNLKDPAEELKKVARAIEHEIQLITDASKDEKNMSMIEGEFNAPPLSEGGAH